MVIPVKKIKLIPICIANIEIKYHSSQTNIHKYIINYLKLENKIFYKRLNSMLYYLGKIERTSK